MIFFKYSIPAKVVLTVAILTMNACSISERKEDLVASGPVMETASSEVGRSEEIRTQEEFSANPYITIRPDVPATAQRRFSQALEHFRQGDLLTAERDFISLTRDYPSLSGPWLNLGLLYQRSERFELAPAQFEAAIQANKLNLNAYNQLAISLREQGKFEDAERQYLAALAVWPDHPPSHRNLGILYDLYMGREADALPHYQRAWQLEPEPTLKIWMMDLQRRVSSGSHGERLTQ